MHRITARVKVYFANHLGITTDSILHVAARTRSRCVHVTGLKARRPKINWYRCLLVHSPAAHACFWLSSSILAHRCMPNRLHMPSHRIAESSRPALYGCRTLTRECWSSGSKEIGGEEVRVSSHDWGLRTVYVPVHRLRSRYFSSDAFFESSSHATPPRAGWGRFPTTPPRMRIFFSLDNDETITTTRPGRITPDSQDWGGI
ncbi:hypothetical protein C8R45DRAFT_1091472 [Mycena sanguinolenta]|nr:hypothetical protein C8R45DRAFT_1091472 [Mycena sanguinolenta]